MIMHVSQGSIFAFFFKTSPTVVSISPTYATGATRWVHFVNTLKTQAKNNSVCKTTQRELQL